LPKTNKNIITLDLSGGLGKQLVFVQETKGKRQYMRRWPKKIDKRKRTESQIMHLRRFYIHGTDYWKNVKSDPDLLAAYQAKAVSPVNAYNLAMKDFMSDPEIKEVVPDRTSSAQRPVIRIRATDVIGVKKVDVTIMQTNGTIILSGPATRSGHSDNWLFAFSLPDPSIGEIRVKVNAYDFPENSTTTECLFSFPFIDTLTH
jgi:hypothetical protein